MSERIAVAKKLSLEYKTAVRSRKGELIDQLCALSGWNRDYARKQLAKYAGVKGKTGTKDSQKAGVAPGRGRKKVYCPKIISSLEKCWLVMGAPCGKILAPSLKTIVPLLIREGELNLTQDQQEQLMGISAATIDRKLKRMRATMPYHGRSLTKPGSLLKTQIPVRTWSQWDEKTPGFLEIDLVGHEGGNAKGDFCYTLTMTDIATGWTVNRSIYNKAAKWVVQELDYAKRFFPFPIKGIDSDNGSEFINDHLMRYCEHNTITFTRSRPGNKNDSCYVEQKNWSRVRTRVGYFRYDTHAQKDMLNQLWDIDAIFMNLLLPNQKLISKTRHGAKISKTHDTALTPYQRLCQHHPQHITTEIQEKYDTILKNFTPATGQRKALEITKKLEQSCYPKTDKNNDTTNTTKTDI